MHTFKIYTLGCKANQYDSQVIREKLGHSGLKELVNGRKADCCVINTCTVTASADRQSRYLIRRAKRENPLAKVVVTGCYAYSNAEDIRRIEGTDLILNNQDKHRILDFLFPQNKFSISPDSGISRFQGHTRAFVKVQDGCDNFCSFCKVPYVRGRSQSRNFTSVIQEIKRLSENGYKEIVLTGICLGDFGKDLDRKKDLTDLIDEIEKLDGVLRIRLSSIEAKDVTHKLIRKLKTSKKLCPHLHIPFQSGDNKILKLMNRRDNRRTYLNLVSRLRKNVKDIAITTDIMIGFPGEGRKEFTNTLDFLEKVEPSRVHIFTFQPRDLTPLSNAINTVEKQELKRRFCAIKTLTDGLVLKFKNRFLNRKLTVLFEEKKDGLWQGYTDNYLLTCLKNNDNLNNKLIEVTIKEANASILSARLNRG